MRAARSARSERLRRWMPLAAVAVTALAVWLSVRKVNIGEVGAALSRADYGMVGAAAAASLLGVVVLSARWRLLLRPGGAVGTAKLFRLNIVSQYINILAPGRFGELARSVMVARRAPFSTAFAVGTVAVEKALDFLVFLALWVSLPAIFSVRGIVREYTAAAVTGGVLAAVLVIFSWKPEPVLRGVRRILGILPRKLRQGGAAAAEQGLEAFRVLRDVRAAPALAGLTLLVLAGQVLPNWLLFRAFGLDVPLWGAFFVLIVIQVGNLPPSLPGKIGIFQFAVILALTPFGVGRDMALGYGIMLHAVTFVPRIVLGIVFTAGMGAAVWKVPERKTAETVEGMCRE